MNQRPNRRLILMVLGVITFLAVIIALLLHFSSNKKAAFYTQEVVDSCTGQTFTTTPNQGAEKLQSSNRSVLIGGAAILNAGASQAQYQKIQQALAVYLRTNLKGHYNSLTVAPNTLSAVSGSAKISAKLCLGLSNQRVNVVIKLTKLRYVEVIITDPSGHNGGSYDSGVLDTAPQPKHGL